MLDEFCLGSGEKIRTFSLCTLLYQQFRVNTRKFRVISRKFRVISRKLRVYSRNFRVSYAFIRETFALFRESFALFRVSYAFIRESFALIRESYALIREKYNFFLYENEPNRLSYNSVSITKQKFWNVSTVARGFGVEEALSTPFMSYKATWQGRPMHETKKTEVLCHSTARGRHPLLNVHKRRAKTKILQPFTTKSGVFIWMQYFPKGRGTTYTQSINAITLL